MLIVGGSPNSLNSLIITNPLGAGTSTESLANLSDVNLSPAVPALGQFLVFSNYDHVTGITGGNFWRNEELTISGTDGIVVTGSAFNWGLSLDNTVIRTGTSGSDQTINSDLTITGALTVIGGTTSATVGVDIGTNLIILNGDLPPGTQPTLNGSFFVYRGDTGQPSEGIVWNEVADRWVFESRSGVDPSTPGYPANGNGTVVGPPVTVPPQPTYNTIWSAWNDGENSGLDADLLDGKQGSFYTTASNLISGTLPVGRLPAFVGDVTSNPGSSVLTLQNVAGLTPGKYGSSTTIPVITISGKGIITVASSQPIPFASDTAAGLISTATQAETAAGVISTKAVTPNSLVGALDNLQPKNNNLTSISLQTLAPDTLIYGVGPGQVALTSLPAYGRDLISSIDAQAARDKLGIGTSFNGNAASATKLATARTINGVAFDGTANITVPVQPDAGWVTIPLLNGFTQFAGDGSSIPANPLRCRKIGNVVYVQGNVSRSSPPGSGIDIGTLPVGYRPTTFVNANLFWISVSTYSSQMWLAHVRSDGRLNTGFTYNLNNDTPATGSGNIGFNFSFVVD